MEDLTTNDYNGLVEEIKATITESVHNSRWLLIDGYWNVGKLIRSYSPVGVTNITATLAVDVGVGERTLWYALKLYDSYPDLNLLPEGKNISWNKLVTKYLSEKKPEIEHCYECPSCKFRGGLDKFVKV